MDKPQVFDCEAHRVLHERRKEFLGRLLREISSDASLATALDAGCGVGAFSSELARLGLKVAAFDGREANVKEAKRRYQNIDFYVHDVEDPGISRLGQFDLVLSFGLLYHLENPFRAIRNLYNVTKKVLAVESMVLPGSLPIAILRDEGSSEDQGLKYIAFVPSESVLIKMLYRAGFPFVYRTKTLPDYEDFKNTFLYKKRRTILVASKIELRSPLFIPVRERQEDGLRLWHRNPNILLRRLGGAIKKTGRIK